MKSIDLVTKGNSYVNPQPMRSNFILFNSSSPKFLFLFSITKVSFITLPIII